MKGKKELQRVAVPQTILMVQEQAQTIPIQKLKITKSEAPHQCQAKKEAQRKWK